jgi:hypothetical protein
MLNERAFSQLASEVGQVGGGAVRRDEARLTL